MKNKKILLLTENFPPISGGSGRWFFELYSRLARHQYHVLAGESVNCLEFDTFHSLPISRAAISSPEWGIRNFAGLKLYWRSFKAVRQAVKQHQITEIHCGRVIHEGVTALLAKILLGIPYVCYVHGEDVETAATSREHDIIVKQVCKSADYLICNSQNTADIVVRLGYATEAKIRIMHPGVDANRFVPAETDAEFRDEMGWNGRKVILTVGRLQARKGQDMMIKAMPHIIKNIPDALYVVVGGGEGESKLHRLSAELGLENHLQFLSELDDEQMIACYQQCDLFILPNRTIENDIEGFGMVLVEAQACGKVVIAGDSGGTKETMLIGESGLVIDCTQPDIISSCVGGLLGDPERRVRMGKAGREHVIARLDWQAHVTQAKQLFDL